MLRILGSERRLCDGLTRRELIHAGGLGMLGIGLEDYFRLKETHAAPTETYNAPFGQAKSCIFLYPYGSPPQHETFDPKPEAPAEIRGDLGPIAGSVPGTYVGELMPNIAKVMDRVTAVRSMTHPYPVHCTAYVVSGIPTYSVPLEVKPRDPQHWPYIGSVVDYVLDHRADRRPLEIPRNMALPWKMNKHSGNVVFAGPWAAFLGTAYDPVLTEFAGKATRVVRKQDPAGGPFYDVHDPYAGISPDDYLRLEGTEPKEQMTIDRFQRRQSLLEQFDDSRGRFERDASTRGYDRYRQMAVSMMTSPRMREALDLSRESMSRRERYGMTLFGQSCLTARRLVEAGSKFVTVFWDEYGLNSNSDWDLHWDQTRRLKEWLMPGFDLGFSGLIRDLDERGLLDETLVVWLSEHGRTPRFNGNGGRDHWSRVYSVALAGGGVARGKLIGESDANGGDVKSNPVSPKDILATIYYLLGIDPHATVPDLVGRPMPIAGSGVLRPELF
ncbi:MAG: DUF1501 domain-containing protein [Planctomycetaceae bacterium]